MMLSSILTLSFPELRDKTVDCCYRLHEEYAI
jgi:hypothetical protein